MTQDQLKQAVAQAAVDYIFPHLDEKSIVGVGTGCDQGQLPQGSTGLVATPATRTMGRAQRRAEETKRRHPQSLHQGANPAGVLQGAIEQARA